MNTTSILMKGDVESLLKSARENIERDGYLIPVLIVDIAAAVPVIVMLDDMPNTPELRQAYFAKIGTQFRQHGYQIREAISLAESWIVQTQQDLQRCECGLVNIRADSRSLRLLDATLPAPARRR